MRQYRFSVHPTRPRSSWIMTITHEMPQNVLAHSMVGPPRPSQWRIDCAPARTQADTVLLLVVGRRGAGRVLRMPSIFGHQATAVTCHDRFENCQLINLERTCSCSTDRSHWGVVKWRATTTLSGRVRNRPTKLSQNPRNRRASVEARRSRRGDGWRPGRASCHRAHCLRSPSTAADILKALL
jgi:hypothetical protein